MMTLYDHLGLDPSATGSQIRTAFEAHRVALRDARRACRTEAGRARLRVEWRALHAAWDILGHPARRRQYDRHLRGLAPRPTRPALRMPEPLLLLFPLALLAGIAMVSPLHAALPLLLLFLALWFTRVRLPR